MVAVRTQAAIELELSTLPPYLCGYWCLKDGDSYPAIQLNNIFFQEMAHFGYACNLLSATGKQPDVLGGYGHISYTTLTRNDRLLFQQIAVEHSIFGHTAVVQGLCTEIKPCE